MTSLAAFLLGHLQPEIFLQELFVLQTYLFGLLGPRLAFENFVGFLPAFDDSRRLFVGPVVINEILVGGAAVLDACVSQISYALVA